MSFQFSPADIVLSCTICQETLSTIYADDDRNDGLHKDGEVPNDGKITKLWLTECAHVTCGKHLPGGGVPFHSVRDVPRAPCPLCSIEKNDHSNKALFFINGTSKGEYDENIPDAYFRTPPVQLSGGSPGLEALRFQYLSLLRSGIKTQEKLIGSIKALKRWEDKKPEIVRSLSSVAPLRAELLSARRRLKALGEDVSSIETALQLAGVNLTEALHPQQQIGLPSQRHRMDLKLVGQGSPSLDGGLRLAQGSAADLEGLNQGAGPFKQRSDIPWQDLKGQDGSSSKRKRVDSRMDSEPRTKYALRGGDTEKCQSRDQMPPPPIPIHQPFVYRARIPSSELHSLYFQHNNVDAAHSQRTHPTPQRHPLEGGLSGLLLEPSKRLPPRIGTNHERSPAGHRQSPRAKKGTPGPVHARGGWQPPLGIRDTERLRYYGSPGSSLPSSGQPSVRCSTGCHRESLIFPTELENPTVDSGSRSYHTASSDGSSSYHRRLSAAAVHPQLESLAPSGNQNPSPNRESRITLPRTPSFASQQHSSNKGFGLSNHVRSSGRQTNHQSTSSSSHDQQLVTTTPAYQRPPVSAPFSARMSAYCSPLPFDGQSNIEMFRRNDSFDSGSILVNGEMRPFSSNTGEFVLLA